MASAAAVAKIFVYVYDNGEMKKQQIVPAIGPETEIKGKQKTYFNSHIMSIRGMACVGNVSEQYISGRFGKNNILIVMGPEIEVDIRGKMHTDIEPIGFIIANHNAVAKDLYIDVICSSPLNGISYGAHLLKYANTMAEAKGCNSITLNSLPSVLTYYPTQGFKFRKDCGEPLVEYEGSALQARARELKVAGTLPTTSDEAYAIDEYVEFMKLLHAADLNKKKEGLCAKGRRITSKNIRDDKCGTDGYTMTKCFTRGGRRRRTTRRAKARRI
jgi:hypothetical protein